ncbi:right-handed parallel beta-helix repeat-containing protein [Aquipseudomonas campi]|uniref:Right-handed parallel beta-helix repeat-containing protein n=1 Tax=Aquipseudomonas campi TaxID=2731681 RepID=A0A6M8FG60_9GAMM|nr:DUF6519 domain-containing protein [Pseudomonas campi]QKE63262.1 right-handed parallel beta-helix repeat-containing protein [Pseudomonas campi]
MSFDLSRVRFDARRDFLGVVMQQGRVQLDADWNEWVAQLARRIQAGALDTFGGNVVPRITPDGFRIEAGGGSFTIGAGRIYVDGLLAENHGAAPNVWEPRLAELTGSAALGYANQPYYPNPPVLPQGGPHLVYVDVWQRDVTAVEAPDLVEKAVGVDSTGRLQTVWQVKVLANVGNSTCATEDEDVPGWQALTAPSAARLSTSTGVPNFEPDPCQVPPAAGYRGLENQLYRVEVHRGGTLGTATFKWSRDNATVASRVSHINPARDRITVESIGRDDVLRFHDGDWVEVTDDWRELHGLPGELRRIRVAGGVDESARTLQFDLALPAGMFPTNAQQATQAARNTRVRRWDQAGVVRRENGNQVLDLNAPGAAGDIVIPAVGTRLFLEHGILVEFALAPAGGQFKTGDYWVFAARTVDASIEELNQAPPLGIHHHYARLAMVNFPDNETDCRVLWPPIAEGEGCDCTVCVSAEGHNSGVATIQQAIDSIKDVGGTICLGIGTYNLRETLTVDDANSLRIRGQGWGSLLVGSQPGSVIDISASNGVALENLSLIASTSSASSTAALRARNTVDLRAEHINVLCLATGEGTSAAISLGSNMLGVSIDDCALVAERGIVRAGEYLLSAELRVTRNLFFCSQRALNLDGISLHYGNTRIDGNLMITGTQTALVATGAVLPGSPFTIADNVIYTQGDGIRAGVDGLRIRDNEISGAGERSGDGIVLEEGLDPQGLSDVRIEGNRLSQLQGNAILIHQHLDNASIAGNLIEGIGLGALVMGEGGSATTLGVTGNRCRHLGLAANVDGTAYAAVQLIRVQRGDFCDNLIAEVARDAVISPAIAGLRAAAVGQLRVVGNRFLGIGPDRSSGEMVAIQILPPFERSVVEGNHVDRVGDDEQQKPVNAIWRAIQIAPVTLGGPANFSVAYMVPAPESTYLLSANRAYALARQPADLAIQNNRLRAHLSSVPLNLCASLEHCLFAGNHCETLGAANDGAQSGELQARTLNASNNRLRGQGDHDTLHLHPDVQVKQAIVIGNTSTGNIRVINGAPIPNDMALTNIIGF